MMKIKAKKLLSNLSRLCSLEDKYINKVQFELMDNFIVMCDITSPKKRELKRYGVAILNFRSEDFEKEIRAIEIDIHNADYYEGFQDSKGIKLDNAQVFDIKQKWDSGAKADELAEHYKVSIATIYNIVNSRSRLKTIFKADK